MTVSTPLIAFALIVLAAGILVLATPGLRHRAAELRQALRRLWPDWGDTGALRSRPAMLKDLDRLDGCLPLLANLPRRNRLALAAEMTVHWAPAGAAIVRAGDADDSAYFVLDGTVEVKRQEDDGYRLFEVLSAGDFFGEVAALTGVPHTADLLAEQPATMLQIPVAALRMIIADSCEALHTARKPVIDRSWAEPRARQAPQTQAAEGPFATIQLS